jgi:thioredoxin 1
MTENKATSIAQKISARSSRPLRLAILLFVLLVAVLGFLRVSNDTPASAAVPPIPVAETTTATFGAQVLQSPIPVVLQFDADWCPYCRKLQPMLRQFAADRQGRIAVYKVNIDREPGLAQLFSVRSLPTLILVKNGMESARLEGVPNKIRLYAWAAQ